MCMALRLNTYCIPCVTPCCGHHSRAVCVGVCGRWMCYNPQHAAFLCCAGTPISHGGKSDLLGLLKFLQVPHIPAGEELTTGG